MYSTRCFLKARSERAWKRERFKISLQGFVYNIKIGLGVGLVGCGVEFGFDNLYLPLGSVLLRSRQHWAPDKSGR